jgi:hypothetical protein
MRVGAGFRVAVAVTLALAWTVTLSVNRHQGMGRMFPMFRMWDFVAVKTDMPWPGRTGFVLSANTTHVQVHLLPDGPIIAPDTLWVPITRVFGPLSCTLRELELGMSLEKLVRVVFAALFIHTIHAMIWP